MVPSNKAAIIDTVKLDKHNGSCRQISGSLNCGFTFPFTHFGQETMKDDEISHWEALWLRVNDQHELCVSQRSVDVYMVLTVEPYTCQTLADAVQYTMNVVYSSVYCMVSLQ